MPPAAQLASRLTPRGWLIAGGAARRRDPVRLPVRAHGLRAELHDARQRRRTVADGQDDEHAQRPGHQLRAAEQRHRDRRAVQPGVQGARRARRREPARQHPAGLHAAVRTTRTWAKATSSSRSPTSAPCRGSSTKRSTACRASPARRSSSCCRAPRTRSSAKARTRPRPRCCCRERARSTRPPCAGSRSWSPRACPACS